MLFHPICLCLLLLVGACAAKSPRPPSTATAIPHFTEPELITLPDGRRMAVHHFGDPHGSPLLLFHGWPSDGSLGAILDTAARKHHFRILAPDRPGIGRSDPLPGRKLTDWPADVRAISAHYGFGKFSVIGISGGGPYALAIAHAMPSQVLRTAVISGAPPLDAPADTATLLPAYRKLLRMRQSHPGMLRFGFRAARSVVPALPDRWLRPGKSQLSAPDHLIFADPQIQSLLTDTARRSFRGSRDGVHDDAVLYACPWDFSPALIRTHVEFWHGAMDINFPPALARKLAASIPGAHIHVVPGEGHYSLPVNRADAIFATLARQGR